MLRLIALHKVYTSSLPLIIIMKEVILGVFMLSFLGCNSTNPESGTLSTQKEVLSHADYNIIFDSDTVE